MKRVLSLSMMLFVIVMNAMAQSDGIQRSKDRFCIASNGSTATIVVDENDWKGVLRAANDLGDDVRKVTGTAAPVVESNSLTSNLLHLSSSA